MTIPTNLILIDMKEKKKSSQGQDNQKSELEKKFYFSFRPMEQEQLSRVELRSEA